LTTGREHLNRIPPEVKDKTFGNGVYRITFEDTDVRPVYGHRYWFYLQDAVENVPEYVVRWDNFVQYVLHPFSHPLTKRSNALSKQGSLGIQSTAYIQERISRGFTENQTVPEFKQLLIKMGVVDPQGESAMDEDQWDAASTFILSLV
jgi:mRNA (guanine-N7-)-methyltransferase